jgi:branched-chain amino acid transport system substrate-binding protein
VIAAAMTQAGTTKPPKLLPVLRNIRHAGITAEISFDNAGALQQGQLSVFRVQGGKWILQEPPPLGRKPALTSTPPK